jgi:hypothetical protein
VSEERGVISLVDGGEITESLDARGLSELLRRTLGGGAKASRPTHRTRRIVAAESSDA